MNPNLKILGVEIDKERVENALPFADEKTFFRLSGFNLPLKESEHVRLIRAFNVLRQYEEKDFAPAYERLAQYVLPGGLVIEGTSNPFGSIWVANVARKVDNVTLREAKSLEQQPIEILRSLRSLTPPRRPSGGMTNNWNFEALVFSTNFRLGFDVQEFQTVLPKNLIHHITSGEPIYDFFEAWKESAAETSAMKAFGARQWFVNSAESLARKGYQVNLQKKFLSRGYLIWEL